MHKKISKIYMDYAATTPVDNRVLKAMQKYWNEEFGNPSSVHSLGVNAKRAIEDSRKKVASVLTCRPSEIIFTGGGTESDNLAVFGVARRYRDANKTGGRIIISAIEHNAVSGPAHALKQEGFEVTVVSVTPNGIIDPSEIKKALRPDTFLVSIMYANNEIGTIQPISEIAKVIRHHRLTWSPGLQVGNYPYFHTDACQAPGALSLNVAKLGVDLMTLSGSKVYGPKGSGALYIKGGTKIDPIVYGGGQERGFRSGTESVPLIVGFGEALSLIEYSRQKESVRLLKLRNYFADSLLKNISGSKINGDMVARLPNNINIFIPNIESEQLIIELDAIGVAASAGSACNSHETAGSHVIWAISGDSPRINGSIRFTLGKSTTKKDIDYVLKSLPEILSRIQINY